MKRNSMGMIMPGESWIPVATLVAREARLTSSEFRIFIVLASYYPNIFPSIMQIMDDTGLARQTVVKSLRSLRDLNVIRWEIKDRRRHYILISNYNWNLTARNDVMSKRQKYVRDLRERDAARRAAYHERAEAAAAAMQEESRMEDDR